jgi:hypothetical protein
MTSDLPDSFKQRNVYPDKSGIWKYKLTQMVGAVVYQEPGQDTYDLKKVVLPNGYTPMLEVIKDADGLVFDGTVNKSAGVKGSYLSFAASLDENEIATFTVTDRNIVFIDNQTVPWDLLHAEAIAAKPNPATRRYWIQGVLLSTLDATQFSEISGNASGVVGPTMGAQAKVYNQSKISKAVHDYRISVQFVDLDKLAQKFPDKVMPAIADILRVVGDLQPKGITLLKFRESDFK